MRQCMSENEVINSCSIIGKRRQGKIQSADGTVYLCSNAEEHLISGRFFKRELNFYRSMLSPIAAMKASISKIESDRVNRLFHNITSLNAHSIQEIYAIVPQDSLQVNFREQKKIMREHVEKNINETSEALLRILKNEMSAKSEFSVFKKLYNPNPILTFANHEIHKVILNVVTLFFQDLADRNIKIYISESNKKIKLDYESFQVAIYHLLDNATKYTEPGSDIVISFVLDADKFKISFAMISLYIDESELELIFDDGYSGIQAKNLGGAGTGLGMGLIRRLLLLNSATIETKAGSPQAASTAMIFRERKYAQNIFTIEFKIKII